MREKLLEMAGIIEDHYNDRGPQVLIAHSRPATVLRTLLCLATSPPPNPLYTHRHVLSVCPQPRTIVIISRVGSNFTNNKSDYVRYWYRKVLHALLALLHQAFPKHEVQIYADADMDLMNNYPRQIKMFYDADIVLAFHGAGLMNTIFMKPGRVVVEILPYIDARMPPVVGIFPRVSAVVGLHHYSYYIGNYPIAKTITELTVHNVVDLDPARLVNDTRHFALEVGLDV